MLRKLSDESTYIELKISEVENSRTRLFETYVEVESDGLYELVLTLDNGELMKRKLMCLGELNISHQNPFINSADKYGKISRIYYEILQFFIPKGISVLEAGSSTGHLSFELAKEGGRKVSLIEIRPKAVKVGKKKFEESGLSVDYFLGDFLDHDIEYDFIWNTGLFCSGFDDKMKESFVRKASELAGSLLVICGDNVRAYPQMEMEEKRKERGSIPRGGNPDLPIGVGAAITYPGINVPTIFSKNFKNVYTGMISQSDGYAGSERFWTFGTNEDFF